MTLKASRMMSLMNWPGGTPVRPGCLCWRKTTDNWATGRSEE